SELSFNYPNFQSVEDITFQGGASPRNETLQLTPTDSNGIPIRQRAGHAVYSQPFQLRDTSFYTTFTFVIRTTSNSPADGFAIFIAPPDFPVKRYGGYLGLFEPNTATNTSANKVVAVEFDTWVNTEWKEPRYRHIGIDVNSIVSVRVTRWQDKDVFSRSIATAHVGYDGISKILTAFVTYPDGGNYVLSHVVDLAEIFPGDVRIGFSGATGQYETQYIHSWSFSSTSTNLLRD
uniref:Lectin n=2 Tax=Bauhinia forficata TaxID=413686 RepID=LECT_BAUFO|nr:RecName: Full=Lectin; Short=BfL [Bauhinia forficata]